MSILYNNKGINKQYLIMSYYLTRKLGYLPKEKRGNFWTLLRYGFLEFSCFFYHFLSFFHSTFFCTFRYTHLSKFIRFLLCFYLFFILFISEFYTYYYILHYCSFNYYLCYYF